MNEFLQFLQLRALIRVLLFYKKSKNLLNIFIKKFSHTANYIYLKNMIISIN